MKNKMITDPMGQWNHPGKNTRIPSGDITMAGVPYPVLGIDNLGNQQMMMPGQDYQFPGEYVDEFPVTDQYRRGGQRRLPRKYTSKNIQSSINFLMRRNELIYGPKGKNYYVPPKQYGGNHMKSDETVLSLNNMKQKAKSGGSPFPTQPTEKQFFTPTFIPNSPVGFYRMGGANLTNGIAFPQQPTMNQFFNPYMNLGGGIPQGYHMMEDGSIMDNDEMPDYKSGGNWIKKANKKMKQKGTKGAFTEYCGGKVTDECIQRALKSSNPTTRKRASFAKAMRTIAKKQMGGSTALQGSDTDSIIDSRKNYFNTFARNNALGVWADEEAMNLSNMHSMMMAQMGMEVPGDEMNQNTFAAINMYEQQNADMAKTSAQDMMGMYDSMMGLAMTQDPHYEMQTMQYGGYPYMGYSAAPYLIPMNQNQHYKFRTNYSPGPGSFMPPNFDPKGMKNFKFDYRSRLFGPGPRRVKMSWDEFSPMTQQQQQPASIQNAPVNMPNMGYPSFYVDPMQVTPPVTSEADNFNGSTPVSFQKGGVYELSQDQIKAIMEAGGEVEIID